MTTVKASSFPEISCRMKGRPHRHFINWVHGRVVKVQTFHYNSMRECIFANFRASSLNC